MPKLTKAQETATAIIEAAQQYNFKLEVRGGILTIHSWCDENENRNDWFRNCDMTAFSVLTLLKRTEPGSDWGTDGGSIGGLTAINGGHFVMNRSGGSKRILAALEKMLG
jgi:hypothetical protein